jgi:hypothetical protein
MKSAEICREVIDALFAAFAAGDWGEMDRLMYVGVKMCDATPGELLGEMVKMHADAVGEHIAKEIVTRLRLYSEWGDPHPWFYAIIITNVKYKTLFNPLGCEEMSKVVASAVRALKANPMWIGPTWMAVNWLLSRTIRLCRGIPDEVAEALGEDEYARLVSSREDGAGIVELFGEEVFLHWVDSV